MWLQVGRTVASLAGSRKRQMVADSLMIVVGFGQQRIINGAA